MSGAVFGSGAESGCKYFGNGSGSGHHVKSDYSLINCCI
jgi:hypothetical protein